MSAASLLRTRLLAIFACLLWSSAFVAVKQAQVHQPPLTLAGLRFMLAGLLLLPICRLGSFRLLREEFGTVLLVSLFHTILLYGTFFIGMQWVRGAEAAIMIGGGPLASALMAHWLMPNDRLTPRMLFSLLLGISGVVLISLAAQPWSPGGMREFGGLMLLLSGSFISAFGNICVAKRKAHLDPVALNSAQMFVGGVVLMIFALPIEGVPNIEAPPAFYGRLLWLSTISAVSFAIWFYLLRSVKVSQLNLWKFLGFSKTALGKNGLPPASSPRQNGLVDPEFVDDSLRDTGVEYEA